MATLNNWTRVPKFQTRFETKDGKIKDYFWHETLNDVGEGIYQSPYNSWQFKFQIENGIIKLAQARPPYIKVTELDKDEPRQEESASKDAAFAEHLSFKAKVNSLRYYLLYMKFSKDKTVMNDILKSIREMADPEKKQYQSALKYAQQIVQF